MKKIPVYPRISRFKTPEAFQERLKELGLSLPLDDRILTAFENSPLAESIDIFGKTIGNRWCIHPMEGWDGEADGNPSEYTLRRWRRFGESGAKLIFGGEATAVREDGRSSPNQIMAVDHTKNGLAELRNHALEAHKKLYGRIDDLLIGLQLTHSGRFSKPNRRDRWEPKIAYHHPILDAKFGIDPNDDTLILSDSEIEEIIECYIHSAKIAYDVGFDFVDVKHCHGYLAHELLSAYTRPGKYGGSFENRTRFLRMIVDGIRAQIPGLHIAVRLSAFDLIPFHDDKETASGNKKGVGIPHDYQDCLPYRYGFGTDENNPLHYDLTETFQFIQLLEELNIPLVNVSCGSPYYNPHIQRPAYYPPSDGYRPPEDPLVGVVRQIDVTRQIKERFPNQVIIGTGYTYLQEYLPLVAQAVVRKGWADIVGIGRMALVYPQMPAESLTKGKLNTKIICRTFSDCTTAPRHGMMSGCYPLDDFYKQLPEAEKVKEVKKG